MATYFGIINALEGSPREKAILEVTADDALTVSGFVHLPSGGATALPPMQLTPDNQYYASSTDLFALSDRQTALVEVTSSGGPLAAIVRQSAGRSKSICVISNDTIGKNFALPIGEAEEGLKLLLANPESLAVQVQLLYADGEHSSVNIAGKGVAIQTVSKSKTRLHLRVDDTGHPGILAVLCLSSDRLESTVILPG
jgi:hypothetical protein